jgi:outer membrane lipopolysaccharide assembly protein LptE/RlpB
LQSQDKSLIKKKSIMISKLLTLNQNALLTTNNQLDLLTIEIQQAAIGQLINELKAFSSVSSYNQSQAPLEEIAPEEDTESPLLPYEDGSDW